MDMLVRLYALNEPDLRKRTDDISKRGIKVRRAMPYEKERAVLFVQAGFGEKYKGWPSECDVSFSNSPASCFISTFNKEIIGFACYNSTCKGFFGPTGVVDNFRGKGIGGVLLLSALFAMTYEGYAYAVIGGVEKQSDFYKKIAGATVIDGSEQGIYKDILQGIET